MAEVLARVLARRGAPAEVAADQPAAGTSLDPEVAASLHQARVAAQASLPDVPLLWRTPVVGHVWREVRRRIHQEIRITLGALARQQATYNTSVLRALAGVVKGIESLATRAEVAQVQAAQDERVGQLSAEVAALREQVRVLQARLDAGPSGPSARP